jgi:ribonuclease P protein component
MLISITKQDDFKNLLQTGKSYSGRFFSFRYEFLNEDNKKINLGIITSRKFGIAVERNKVRRRIKAIFRQIVKMQIKQTLQIVIIPKRQCKGAPFLSLQQDIEAFIKKVNIMV